MIDLILSGALHYSFMKHKEVGTASFYSESFHGRKTASGERFNMYAMTAAHRKLPFGTRLKITNLSNRKYVIVKVSDRGPFKRNRCIDLSKAAAIKLGMIRSGTALVVCEVLDKNDKQLR